MNKRNISIKNGVVLMMILCVVGLCSIFVKYCISKNEYQREIQDIQTLDEIKNTFTSMFEYTEIGKELQQRMGSLEYVYIPVGYYGKMDYGLLEGNYSPMMEYINERNLKWKNLNIYVSYCKWSAIMVKIDENLAVDVYLTYDRQTPVEGKYYKQQMIR